MKKERRKKVTLDILERLNAKTLRRIEKLQKNVRIFSTAIDYLKLQIKNAPQPYVKERSDGQE